MKHRDINNLGVQRAYATFEVSNIKEPGPGKKRTFTGIASTIETDLMDDIVVPEGAEFRLPLPLLYGHDSDQPIGWVRAARVKKDRIEVDCEVADIDEADSPELKAEINKRWTQLKTGLVRGLSIGFNPIETAQIDGSWGLKFIRWKWLELSACVIACNEPSGIVSIKQIRKSFSDSTSAALGHSGAKPGDRNRPGASGQSSKPPSGGFFHSRSQKGKDTMKTLKELRELRMTKAARLDEIEALWADEKHEKSDDERAELSELVGEVKSLDDEILMAQIRERKAASARPVEGDSSEGAHRSRVAGGMGFVKTQDPDDKFKGQSYVRYLQAKAASFIAMKEGNFITPAEFAKQRWGKSHPKLVEFIRAAVAGGGTGSGEWGAELAASDTRFTGDFVEFLYGMTVFDRLPLRAMPARVHVKGQDGAATGYWTGESKAIAVSKADFSDVELTPLKVAALAVCSKELVADSSPEAGMWIRDSIAQASAQRVDTTFLGQAAASAGVSPAGIGNGISALSPSGADAAAVRADLMALYLPFLNAKNASGLVQIMNPSMAKAISLLVNALGQKEFAGLKATGGELEGDTVYTGDNVAGGDWYLLKPSDIWKIGDSGIDVSMSDQATIEMNDAPAGASDTPTAMATHAVSLWQTESVGFKVVRRINYKIRRAGAVNLLQNGEYGGVAS
jgi:hypothetical protein